MDGENLGRGVVDLGVDDGDVVAAVVEVVDVADVAVVWCAAAGAEFEVSAAVSVVEPHATSTAATVITVASAIHGRRRALP